MDGQTLPEQQEPQVPEIRLPGTAQRSPLEALALHLSAGVQRSSKFRRWYRLIATPRWGW
jgi:hypothetical protein